MKKTVFTFLLALLFCMQANAQGVIPGNSDLAMIFQSDPGTQPAQGFFTDFDNTFDANGDGTPDLILTTEDSDGNLHGIRVVDVALGTTLWEVQDVPQTLGFVDGTDFNLFGFADPDADGKPEAIFVSEQDVVLINPSDNSLSFSISVGLPLKMAGVTDLTGDGHPELIVWVADGAGGYVQVWSKP